MIALFMTRRWRPGRQSGSLWQLIWLLLDFPRRVPRRELTLLPFPDLSQLSLSPLYEIQHNN